MVIFSEMLCNTLNISVEKGDLEGICCICKKTTKEGFKKKFSGTFTCADYISTGDVICPECNYLVRHSNEYRRTMFLLTEDDFIKFKKKEARDIVLNLPNKPFYLYLTKTWQKIGWIRMNEVYNNDNSDIINFIIDYDIIQCSLKNLKELMSFIQKLRQLKIPKTVLETGNLEMHHYKKINAEYGRNKSRSIITEIKNNVKTPIWDLALFLED